MTEPAGNCQKITMAAILFVGFTLYVLDRKLFMFLIPVLRHEESVPKYQLGIIVSVQNSAAVFSKIFLGILSDKVSPRVMFSLGLICVSMAIIGFAFVTNVPLYAVMWFLEGLVQSSGWPAIAKLLQNWCKPTEFGTYWSVLSSSVNIVGVVVPLILYQVLSFLDGWRNFAFCIGVAGLSWSLVSLILVRNNPNSTSKSGSVSSKEKLEVESRVDLSKSSDSTSKSASVTTRKQNEQTTTTTDSTANYRMLFTSPFLWLIFIHYMVTYTAKMAFDNWGQLLVVEKGHSVTKGSHFLSAFEGGGLLSSLVTGSVTDWVVSKHEMNSKRNPRIKIVYIYTFACAILTPAFTFFTWLAPMFGFFLGIAVYGNVIIFGMVAMECAPAHLSGASGTFVAMGANLGAVLAGAPLSLVADFRHLGWTGAFYVVEVMICISLILMVLCRNFNTQIEAPQPSADM